MAEPTKDDAHLVIELAQLGSQMVHPKARGWIWSDEFVSDADEFFEKYPPGTDEFLYVSSVAGWHETVATLWKRGLVSEELLFDWIWVAGIWDKLKDILITMRAGSGTAQLWANFEAMAEAQVTALSRA
jgi:hypothetical protein